MAIAFKILPRNRYGEGKVGCHSDTRIYQDFGALQASSCTGLGIGLTLACRFFSGPLPVTLAGRRRPRPDRPGTGSLRKRAFLRALGLRMGYWLRFAAELDARAEAARAHQPIHGNSMRLP